MKTFIPQKPPREKRSTWDSCIKLSRPIGNKTAMTVHLQEKIVDCIILSEKA